jgi:hypothetical protein
MAKASNPERKAFTRNIAQVPWKQFQDHFGGALSKPLVMPETAGSLHIDYRISCYQPMAHVARHKHQIQEQIYNDLPLRLGVGQHVAFIVHLERAARRAGADIRHARLPVWRLRHQPIEADAHRICKHAAQLWIVAWIEIAVEPRMSRQ